MQVQTRRFLSSPLAIPILLILAMPLLGVRGGCFTAREPDPENCVDSDHDCVPDRNDNCPGLANTDQADTDGDGLGDPCDSCPSEADPTNADTDGDGICDVLDACPQHFDDTPATADTDEDAIPDACDNCPSHANADQADDDGDGLGNACDEETFTYTVSLYDGQFIVGVPGVEGVDFFDEPLGDITEPFFSVAHETGYSLHLLDGTEILLRDDLGPLFRNLPVRSTATSVQDSLLQVGPQRGVSTQAWNPAFGGFGFFLIHYGISASIDLERFGDAGAEGAVFADYHGGNCATLEPVDQYYVAAFQHFRSWPGSPGGDPVSACWSPSPDSWVAAGTDSTPGQVLFHDGVAPGSMTELATLAGPITDIACLSQPQLNRTMCLAGSYTGGDGAVFAVNSVNQTEVLATFPLPGGAGLIDINLVEVNGAVITLLTNYDTNVVTEVEIDGMTGQILTPILESRDVSMDCDGPSGMSIVSVGGGVIQAAVGCARGGTVNGMTFATP